MLTLHLFHHEMLKIEQILEQYKIIGFGSFCYATPYRIERERIALICMSIWPSFDGFSGAHGIENEKCIECWTSGFSSIQHKIKSNQMNKPYRRIKQHNASHLKEREPDKRCQQLNISLQRLMPLKWQWGRPIFNTSPLTKRECNVSLPFYYGWDGQHRYNQNQSLSKN